MVLELNKKGVPGILISIILVIFDRKGTLFPQTGQNPGQCNFVSTE